MDETDDFDSNRCVFSLLLLLDLRLCYFISDRLIPPYQLFFYRLLGCVCVLLLIVIVIALLSVSVSLSLSIVTALASFFVFLLVRLSIKLTGPKQTTRGVCMCY